MVYIELPKKTFIAQVICNYLTTGVSDAPNYEKNYLRIFVYASNAIVLQKWQLRVAMIVALFHRPPDSASIFLRVSLITRGCARE